MFSEKVGEKLSELLFLLEVDASIEMEVGEGVVHIDVAVAVVE